MTTENYVLALAAVGDTREGFRRLCKAIEEIDRQEAELAEKSRNITEEIQIMYRKWKGRSVLNVILKIVKDVKKRIPAAMACEMKNMPASVVL